MKTVVQVKDFCSREVATVEPLTSLRVASLLMRNRHVENAEHRPLDVA